MKEIRLETEQKVIWHNPASIFKYSGWPTICRDDRGVLYVTASAFRIQHVDPTGKNVMWISRDEGESWSKPIIINDDRMNDQDTGIVYLGGGRMLANWFATRTPDSITKNPGFASVSVEDREMIHAFLNVYRYMDSKQIMDGSFVMLSDDYGFTWSDPIRVPMTATHGPNVLRDGRVVYLGKDFLPRTGEGKVRCYISSDYGRTWEEKGTMPLPQGYGWCDFHEPHVVELPSGRLFGAIRTGYKGVETCFTTYSDDQGETWSVPKYIGISGLPPYLLLHSSGALILTYCNRLNGTQRACVSYDYGETWEQDYVIDDRNTFCDLGYPATAELSDGSLFTVYYQALAGENFPCIMGARWNLQK